MRKPLLIGFFIGMMVATSPIIHASVAGWGWPMQFRVNISYGPPTFIIGETVWVKASCSYSATIELWIYQKVGIHWILIAHFGPVHNQGQLVGSFLCQHYGGEYKFYAFASPSMGIPDSDTKYANSEDYPYYETYPYTHPDNQWMIDFAITYFIIPGIVDPLSPETRQSQFETVCNALDQMLSYVQEPEGGREHAWRDIDQVYDFYEGKANPSCEHRMVILMGLLECLAYLGMLPIYDIQGCYFKEVVGEPPNIEDIYEHYFVRGSYWDCTGAGRMVYFFADAYSQEGTSPEFYYWYWGPQYTPPEFHGYKCTDGEEYLSDVYAWFGDQGIPP